MIDYHCHLDLYRNPMVVFEEAKKRRMDILAVTTSPRAFLKTKQYFVGAPKIRVALGFHPELVEQRKNEWELFINNIASCRYIGEIGIDGSQNHIGALDVQVKFFKEALIKAERSNGRIISIHSRNAAKTVLSSIEQTLSANKPVLHWFTGTVKEVEWALELGCWFSINPKMCATKHGKEIIGKIPLSRMLPETDGPFVINGNKPCLPWDETVIKYLASVNDVSRDLILDLFESNLKNLEKDI